MGGGLVAAALLEGEQRLDCAVLSAPMMGVQLGSAPAWLARLLAGLMAGVGLGGAYAAGPGDPLSGAFETNILTHDRDRWERTLALLTTAPQLQVGGVTWAWLAFALDLALRLQQGGALTVPVVAVAAGEERLVDNAATKGFVRRHPNARYLELKGAYHELLMETDAIRGRFWAEFDALAARVLRG
jgi:lysophospholipase